MVIRLQPYANSVHIPYRSLCRLIGQPAARCMGCSMVYYTYHALGHGRSHGRRTCAMVGPMRSTVSCINIARHRPWISPWPFLWPQTCAMGGAIGCVNVARHRSFPVSWQAYISMGSVTGGPMGCIKVCATAHGTLSMGRLEFRGIAQDTARSTANEVIMQLIGSPMSLPTRRVQACGRIHDTVHVMFSTPWDKPWRCSYGVLYEAHGPRHRPWYCPRDA